MSRAAVHLRITITREKSLALDRAVERLDALDERSHDDELLATRDAAAFLGVSTRQLMRFVESGALPCLTYTRPYRFARRDLRDFVARSRTTRVPLSEVDDAAD